MLRKNISRIIEYAAIILNVYFFSYYLWFLLKFDFNLISKAFFLDTYLKIIGSLGDELAGIFYLIFYPVLMSTIVVIIFEFMHYLLTKTYSKKILFVYMGLLGFIMMLFSIYMFLTSFGPF